MRTKRFFITIGTQIALILFFAIPVSAQNYIVNSNIDAPAVNLVTGETATPGQITLRSAVQAATAQPGAHIITFSGAVVSPINLTLGQMTVGNAANGNNITINGPGMGLLTVNQTTDNRIFSTGTGTVTFVLQNITLNNTGPGAVPYSGGGGAIIAGGASAVTTLTNVTISNFDSQIGNGGAISASSSLNNHSLTITNCIFTNNRCGGAGGAVSFNSQGGTATITGCTFTNNHTGPVGANTGGDGGAVNLSGGGSGGTYLVERNTFLNNQAENPGGHAGAIMSTNGTATIRFNRFIGNTCLNVAFPPLANIIGQAGGATIHTTIADNNWWGVNTGPGPNDATALAAGAIMTLTKWLQLKTTASPNPICASSPSNLGHTSTVTASFLSNSASEVIAVVNLPVLIGLPLTWTSTLGTLGAPQELSIQADGEAINTFTSNGTGGTATVNAQVDNIPASETSPARANITVNTLSVAPTGTTGVNTVCSGGTATLTVAGGVKGTGAVTQWFTGSCGGTLVFTGDAYTTPALIVNTTYFVRYSGICNTTTCASVTVFVNDVTGGTVGSDQTICSGGDPAAFTQSVASTGTGALTYQWQSSTTSCAAGFSDIGGATGTTFNPPAGVAATTFYRRVTTSTLNAVPCTANSNCITVTVNGVTGGAVAANQTICSGGDPATFTQTVASTGSGALTYQWQSSTTSCAAGFSDIGGATATTYDPPAGLLVTTFYRRVATSTLTAVPCTANSNCVTVFVNDVTAGTVAADQTICSGGNPALFTQSVASTGSGALTYQWQSSTTSCAAGFSNIGGATSTTYDAPAGLLVTTYYRRVTTSTLNAVPCTANSNCITVTINDVTAGTVAADQTICSGGDPAAFTESVASTGSGALTYQWQSSTTSCAAGFTDIGGATSTTYDAPAGAAVTTYYRRVTTSTLNAVACTANSNCITVTVNAVTGGTVGSDQAFCVSGDPALFTQSIASTGSGALTYQWQSSTTSCAAGFTDIGGATSTTYDAPAGVAVTTYYRRVTTSTLTGVPCIANSNCITVTISPNNTVTLTSAPGTDNQSVLINTPITNITYATTGATGATFSGLPSGVTGAWAANVVTISGSPTVAGLFNYTVTLTGGCGVITANGSINVTVCSITLTSAAGTNAQSVCINAPITNITYSTTGATGATFSGLPAGVTGAWAANVVTISGSPTAAGTFNYTVTPTGGGCSGAVTATGTITASLIPDAVATPSSQTVCSAVPITTIVLTGAVPGTVFNWTRDNNVTVTGIAASGAGDISGTLTNTTAAPITVTFTITPVNNGCPGTPITATVLVNPTPNAVATPSAQTICSGSSITTIVLSGAVSGTVFNWTRDNTVAVTGIAASGAGDISGSLTNTTNAPVTVTFTITPTANGCPGTPITATIIVNPIPNAVATPSSQSLCSGVAITAIVLTGNVAGTVYNWTRDNTVAVTGIAASGSGNIAGILTNTTTAPVTVTFTITPSYTNAGQTCIGTPITATVTVNPNPAAFTIGGGATVCPTGTTLSGPIDINYTYQWGRSLFVAPFTNMGTAQMQAVTASGVYRLVVTNQYGCSTSNTTVVNVADYVFNGSLGAGDAQQTGRINRFAVVSTCAAPKACPGLFTAAGARYYDSYTVTNIRNVPVCATIGLNSGCGTNIFSVAYSNSFNPASLCTNYLGDPGSSPTTSIFYEVTIPALSTIVVVVHEVNVGVGCVNYQLTVDVPRDPAAITVSPAAVSCSGAPITLTAPAANTYSWNPGGVTTQSILYSGPGTTNYTVTLGYGNNGCTDTRSQSVTIVNPTVNPVANQAACNGSNVSVTFSGSDPLATYNWTNTNTAIGLAASGSGNLNFTGTNGTGAPISGTITVTPVNGPCTGTPTSFTITIANQPSIISVTGAVICEPGGIANLSATGNGTINWYDAVTGGVVVNTGNTYSPNITSTTTYYLESLIQSGPQTLLGMPAQSNTFPGNVRGYWFTAPTDFVITSLSVPTTASSGPQSIAVVKFNGNVPPPVFSATTNAFTTLFLTRNNAAAGSIPCNIPVLAGEVIGFLGYRGNVNSYAPGDYNTTIAGFPVQLQRLGMQFPLTTTNPQNIWREFGATTSISRIEFEYAVSQSCVSAPRVPVTATVNPLPVATATPSSQTICTGSAITTIVLTSTVPGTVFNWTRDNNATVTGIAASGAGSSISGSLTNTTNAPITVTFTITPSYTNAGVTCTGAPITATAVVNPIPNAVATPSSQTICSGTAITTIVLTGNVAGTLFNWTRDNNGTAIGIASSGSGLAFISGSLTNLTNAPVTVTFTITPEFTNAGVTCYGPPITATVVVNPVPNAVATPASQTICSGSAITTIVNSGNVAGTVFNWTRNNTGTVTGIAASGSGNINGSLTNTTNAPVTVTFIITPSYTNAGVTCTGPSVTATVVVNPIPNAVATPAAQTICSGSSITNIILTGNVVNTIFSWTRDNTAAATGIAASGTGDIGGSLVNTTNAPVTVTFTITPSFTNAGVTCTGTPVTATVVVNPIPNAVATPSAQTICSGSAITTIALTGNVTGTVYNWTRNNTGTVTGIAASGSGNISGSLTNTTNAPVTVTFTITPSYTNAGVTCTGAPITATVVVNPIPNAVASPVAQTICSGSSIMPISISGNVSGTVFNWTRDNTVSVTGIAASGSGNISGTLTNTTNAPVTVTFTITPSFTNAGVTCTGAPITATVVVNPIPNAVATPASQTICSANTITTIVLSGNVTGTVYSWTRNNTGTVTGIAGSGSGNISGSLTNTTNAPITVTFTITPSYTNGGVTCTGTSIIATVLVNPTPDAAATPTDQTICSGSAITPITISGNVSGTVFNWTRNNTVAVTGIAASGSGNISGSLTNTTNAPVAVTFTITPIANGCTGASVTAVVLVNPIPNAVATPASQTICSAGTITTIVLSGNVTGTVFNWSRNNTLSVTGIPNGGIGNISGSLTNTTTAPITVTFTITPSYTNGGITCIGTPITATVLVNPTPNAVATPVSQTVCSDVPIIPIVFSGAVSGTTFNWTRDNTVSVTGIGASGSGNISGSLTNNTNAPITVTFTITPTANGCPGAPITATVLVNPTPNAVATPASQTICSRSAITTIVLSGNVPGIIFNWTRDNTTTVAGIPGFGSGNISGILTNNTTGPLTVTFTIIPTVNGCPGTPIPATVVVNPTPTITCPANIVVNAAAGTCSAVVNYPAATATGTPAPTITYSIPTGSTFPVGVTTVTATATNICGTVSCTFTITVNDVQVPVITTQPVNRAVCVGSSATFSVVATNATSYQWQTGNANNQWGNIPGATSSSFTINNTTMFMNNAIYRVAITGPCGTVLLSNPVTLTINPLPTIILWSATTAELVPGRNVTIRTTANPTGGTYTWLFNGNPITGATGTSLGPLDIDNIGRYNVTYTDLNGCVKTSSDFLVTGEYSITFWVYPNPTSTGRFQVRFNNHNGEVAKVRVFDPLGQLVFQQRVTTGPTTYSRIDVDMSNKANGIYTVELLNGSDLRVGAKQVLIAR